MQIYRIYKSEKFSKSHVVLEGIGEGGRGLPFESDADRDAFGLGLGLW